MTPFERGDATAIDARANAANHCPSKAGLKVLTKCMTLELAPHVEVNAIALGFIDSPILRKLYTDEQLAAVAGDMPMATMGSHKHVFAMVHQLASSGSDSMTGRTIILDGGRIMR